MSGRGNAEDENEKVGGEEVRDDERGDGEKGQSREGRWENGKGRCAVTGRRILGGTGGLRRVMV